MPLIVFKYVGTWSPIYSLLERIMDSLGDIVMLKEACHWRGGGL